MQLHAQRMPARASSFAGTSLRTKAFTHVSQNRGHLQVQSALSRQRKEEIVSTLKENLDTSVIVFGFRFQGLDVPTIQKFRKGLPEGSSVMVCKNTLMKVACKDKEQWSTLVEKGCTGDNAWVFVREDNIADTIKHYFKYEEELFADAKKSAPKNAQVKPPTELTCVVMDNKLLSNAELKKCENLPTKKQLLATIASLAKQPARKIATGIKMVPTKLAIAIKKVSEKDEDKTKTVASFAQ